jgi:hypothetical protein
LGHKRVASHPIWPRGGLATSKAKPSIFFFFSFCPWVAKPPPWATGVVRPVSNGGGWPPPYGPKGVAQPPQKLLLLFFKKKKKKKKP